MCLQTRARTHTHTQARTHTHTHTTRLGPRSQLAISTTRTSLHCAGALMRVRGSHIQVFMTTGVLLRRLHGDPELTGITHVIVDEARAQHGAWPVARSVPCMACLPPWVPPHQSTRVPSGARAQLGLGLPPDHPERPAAEAPAPAPGTATAAGDSRQRCATYWRTERQPLVPVRAAPLPASRLAVQRPSRRRADRSAVASRRVAAALLRKPTAACVGRRPGFHASRGADPYERDDERRPVRGVLRPLPHAAYPRRHVPRRRVLPGAHPLPPPPPPPPPLPRPRLTPTPFPSPHPPSTHCASHPHAGAHTRTCMSRRAGAAPRHRPHERASHAHAAPNRAASMPRGSRAPCRRRTCWR